MVTPPGEGRVVEVYLTLDEIERVVRHERVTFSRGVDLDSSMGTVEMDTLVVNLSPGAQPHGRPRPP